LRFVTSRTNLTADLNVMVRQFFVAAGVDLNSNNPANAGKTFVFNDRKGILVVRSTSQDLDMIEAALQALNQAPPEVNIKAKFIEITQNDNRALGYNWWLGNIKLGGTLSSGGTMPSLNGSPTGANPAGTFPGSVAAGTTTPPAATDGSLTQGLRNVFGQQLASTTPTLASITGILTDPQFKVAINALEQRDGVDELTAPEVTTESGRQAQIQAVDLQTIVVGVNVNTSSGSGVSGVANGVNSPIVQQVPTINYPIETLPFGPTLDVVPYVSADEYSVQLTLIPSITEFIGYDSPQDFVPAALVSGQTGNASLTAVLPLPHFRLRAVTTSVTVWDAQTVVIGGLITDSVTKLKDKVPMLGDLPLIGRFFQSQSSSKSKKNLMIFVTPTIINPDGTRFHSDEEMPFNQTAAATVVPKAAQ
jgi:general secretion pathway protein D